MNLVFVGENEGKHFLETKKPQLFIGLLKVTPSLVFYCCFTAYAPHAYKVQFCTLPVFPFMFQSGQSFQNWAYSIKYTQGICLVAWHASQLIFTLWVSPSWDCKSLNSLHPPTKSNLESIHAPLQLLRPKIKSSRGCLLAFHQIIYRSPDASERRGSFFSLPPTSVQLYSNTAPESNIISAQIW